MIRTTVSALGEVITGHTPPTSKREYYGDSFPFLKPTDMIIGQKYTYFTEEGYSDLAATKYRNSLIPKGSTCVVCIGTLGEKMSMAHCDLFTNQSINSIIPDNRFDQHYVYYLLKHNLHRVKALNKGTASGREFVSKTTFLDLEIDVIEDKDKQQKVAQMLSAYDDLIENNQKQIKLLEEAAQRLYKEWFVDLRFPGHEDIEIVDGVPEGWTVKSMEGIADYLNGYAFKPSDWGEIGKPIIKIKELNDGITKDTPRNTGVDIPEKYRVLPGDIVFSWSATLTAKIWDAEEGLLNQHLFKVTPYDGFCREYVLQSILQTLDEFRNLTTGSTMKHIQRGKLKQVFVKVPSPKIMDEYKKYADIIRRQILVLGHKIILLQEARDRLLPKLMNGEMEI